MGDVLSREYVKDILLRTQEDSKYLSLKQTGKSPQGLKDRKGPTRQGTGNSVFQVIRNSLKAWEPGNSQQLHPFNTCQLLCINHGV